MHASKLHGLGGCSVAWIGRKKQISTASSDSCGKGGGGALGRKFWDVCGADFTVLPPSALTNPSVAACPTSVMLCSGDTCLRDLPHAGDALDKVMWASRYFYDYQCARPRVVRWRGTSSRGLLRPANPTLGSEHMQKSPLCRLFTSLARGSSNRAAFVSSCDLTDYYLRISLRR